MLRIIFSIFFISLFSYESKSSYNDYDPYDSYYTRRSKVVTLNLSTTPLTFLNQNNLKPKTLSHQSSFSQGRKSSSLSRRYGSSFSLEEIKPEWVASVSDQGQLGTCASFAVIEALQYTWSHSKKMRLLSQPYLITKAEREHNCLNDGISIGLAMKAARDHGSMGLTYWDYSDYQDQVRKFNKLGSTTSFSDKTELCVLSPYTGFEEEEIVKFHFKDIKALFHTKCQGSSCNNHDLIIKALNEHQCPVITSVDLELSDESGWQRGVVSDKDSKFKDGDGAHAITIFGYDSQNRVFNFKNSWGQGWGDSGCGTISYKYINRKGNEAWVGMGKKKSS